MRGRTCAPPFSGVAKWQSTRLLTARSWDRTPPGSLIHHHSGAGTPSRIAAGAALVTTRTFSVTVKPSNDAPVVLVVLVLLARQGDPSVWIAVGWFGAALVYHRFFRVPARVVEPAHQRMASIEREARSGWGGALGRRLRG